MSEATADSVRSVLPSWAVFHRPARRRAKWELVARAESEEAARRQMFDLMPTRLGGDWRVGAILEPDVPERPQQ